MYYNQYPYSFFNQAALSAYNRDQTIARIQQHQEDQWNNIKKMRKSIGDFLEAAKNISPEYQDVAMKQCIEEIIMRASKE